MSLQPKLAKVGLRTCGRALVQETYFYRLLKTPQNLISSHFTAFFNQANNINQYSCAGLIGFISKAMGQKYPIANSDLSKKTSLLLFHTQRKFQAIGPV